VRDVVPLPPEMGDVAAFAIELGVDRALLCEYGTPEGAEARVQADAILSRLEDAVKRWRTWPPPA